MARTRPTACRRWPRKCCSCKQHFFRSVPGRGRLLVYPRIAMPAVYMIGGLSSDETADLCRKLPDEGLIVFGGSRHAGWRTALLGAIENFRRAELVFSPSYTLYEYSAEEIRGFMRRARFTFINEHEAAFLCDALGGVTIEAAMALNRNGGVVMKGRAGATLYEKRGRTCRLVQHQRCIGRYHRRRRGFHVRVPGCPSGGARLCGIRLRGHCGLRPGGAWRARAGADRTRIGRARSGARVMRGRS